MQNNMFQNNFSPSCSNIASFIRLLVLTLAQNGVAERKNRHFLETARALLFQLHVPKHSWADAVSTACFFINQMPSSVLN